MLKHSLLRSAIFREGKGCNNGVSSPATSAARRANPGAADAGSTAAARYELLLLADTDFEEHSTIIEVQSDLDLEDLDLEEEEEEEV